MWLCITFSCSRISGETVAAAGLWPVPRRGWAAPLCSGRGGRAALIALDRESSDQPLPGGAETLSKCKFSRNQSVGPMRPFSLANAQTPLLPSLTADGWENSPWLFSQPRRRAGTLSLALIPSFCIRLLSFFFPASCFFPINWGLLARIAQRYGGILHLGHACHT